MESYNALQQDPKDVTVFLLQQLVLQTHSFVISDGFINSTISRPSIVKPFTPSLAAQRLNVLWFASLTLSLISASFSIVVKQWLREFLAMDLKHSSPRGRLRVRHFRIPGLSRYMVLEIASSIPLLLQLSLLLFFIGLCYFTAGVHESIGNTTLPLVASWAFLFVATCTIPAIDPQCPYKVPILKPVMKLVLEAIYGGKKKNSSTQSAAHDISSDGLRADDKGRTCRAVERAGTNPPEPTSSDHDKFIHPDVSYTSGNKGRVAYDEDAIASDSSNDVEILVEALKIDAIASNDQLLKDITEEALLQASIQPQDLCRLPFKVLDYRIDKFAMARVERTILDMKNVSHQTYDTIMHLFALIVREGIDAIKGVHVETTKDESNLPPWLEKSICVLLSHSQFSNSAIVDRVLHHSLAQCHDGVAKLICSRLTAKDSSSLALVLRKLNGGLGMTSDVGMLTKAIKAILDAFANITPFVALDSDVHSGPTSTKDSQRACDPVFFNIRSPTCPEDCRSIVENLLIPKMRRYREDGLDFQTVCHIDIILLDEALLTGEIWNILDGANLSLAELSRFLLAFVAHRAGSDVSVIRDWILDFKGELRNDRHFSTLLKLASRIVQKGIGRASILDTGTVSSRASDSDASWLSSPPTYAGADGGLQLVLCFLLFNHEENFVYPAEVTFALQSYVVAAEQYSWIRNPAELIKSRITLESDSDDTLREFSGMMKRLEDGFAALRETEVVFAFIRTLFEHVHPVPSLDGGPSGLQVIKLTLSKGTTISIPDRYREIVLNLIISRIETKHRDASRGDDATRQLLFEGLSQLVNNFKLSGNFRSCREPLSLASRFQLPEDFDSVGGAPPAQIVLLVKGILASRSPARTFKDAQTIYAIALDDTYQKMRGRAQKLLIEAVRGAANNEGQYIRDTSRPWLSLIYLGCTVL